MASVPVPVLACVDPSILTGPFSSDTFPIIRIHIGGWPWLDAVDQDIASSDMISMPQSATIFSSLSVSCCSSCSLPPRRSISSANCKLQSCRSQVDADDSEVSTSSVSYSELSANWSFSRISYLEYKTNEYECDQSQHLRWSTGAFGPTSNRQSSQPCLPS